MRIHTGEKRGRRVRIFAAVLLVLAVGALGLAGCGDNGRDADIGKKPTAQDPEKGGASADTGAGADSESQEAPTLSDFEVEDLDGNLLKKEDVLGQNRLNMVNVWATWCGYCVEEIPSLQKLGEKYADQGFGVVGILTDGVDLENFDPQKGEIDLLPDNIKQAKKIMKNGQADYPVILPDLNLLYEVVAGINSYPTTFFTDQNGKLVGEVYAGMKSEKFWEQTIEDLLAELPAEE